VSELVVLVVEDEPEVRDAVVRDLRRRFHAIRVEESEDADDALAALADAEAAGDRVGLILADHRLPGRSGVDLLVALHDDPRTRSIRKVLLTGQANQEDTIRAVNEARLDHYIAKPWEPDELIGVAVDQLTRYVIEEGLDPLAFMRELDAPRLAEAYAEHPHPD
jgi:response regulator RpfG family c-di-GMP phosphodiesterase